MGLDSEHAQSNGKSVNRGLPVLDLPRGSQRSRFLLLTKRGATSGAENVQYTVTTKTPNKKPVRALHYYDPAQFRLLRVLLSTSVTLACREGSVNS